MKRTEFVKLVSEKLGTSQVGAKETLAKIDEAILEAFNQIEMDDKVPVSELFDVKKDLRKGREGECKIPGKEGTWKTEDKIIAKIKSKKAFDDGIEQ